MTIIRGIEIDNIQYTANDIKFAICNNEPIEEKLHVVIVVSNPCQFARRYILAREFITRIEKEESNVLLYVVELAYEKQSFHVTNSKNKRHLQIKTNTAPLWHKENMINIGIKKLLPSTWKAVAWIDADVAFDSPSWATDTLKILNGSRDIVQLFSHCVDMDLQENAMNIFTSFGFQYSKNMQYAKFGINRMWHPGFAWACTRKAYENLGGLYELSILGSGDHNMALSLIGKGDYSVNEHVHPDYVETVIDFQERAKKLRLGYVPGIIRHYFHGSKKNRKYMERWQILVKHKYSPKTHVHKNSSGLIVPTTSFPKQMLSDILQYFSERNEDEGVIEALNNKELGPRLKELKL